MGLERPGVDAGGTRPSGGSTDPDRQRAELPGDPRDQNPLPEPAAAGDAQADGM
jgi:hypothetical protein